MTLPRPLRIPLTVAAAGIIVSLGTGAIWLTQFNPNSLKPRIIEAVQRATGRDLTLNGKIGLTFSPTPTIRVEDVAFANPPGFSRPQMVTLQSMALEVGLMPLLSGRIEIVALTLIHPDIILETATNGRSNWQMTREVSPPPPADSQIPIGSQTPAGLQMPAMTGTSSSAAPTSGSRTSAGSTSVRLWSTRPTTLKVDTIRIRDGTFAYRDDATGKVTTLGLPQLQAVSSTSDSPMRLDADVIYGGTAFKLLADTGSLTRLRETAATSPWPIKLTLTAAGTKLTAEGTMTGPLRGKGYDLAVVYAVSDASALPPLLQGLVPAALHNVTFTAKLADVGDELPEFSALTLHLGAADLGAWVPGLILDNVDIAAPKADQPMTVDATARLGDMPVTVTGMYAPPVLFLPYAKPAPFPMDLSFKAAGATISAKGMIADAAALTGVNVALTGQIPDLAALSPLARRPLPTLRSLAFRATLTDLDAGFRHGAALHDVNLTSPEGDLSGDAALGLGARDSLTADLKSNRIDLDALQAAIDPTPVATPASPPPAAGSHPPASGTKAQTPPAPLRRRDVRLFSGEPLPFDLARAVDADLKLDIADLHAGGADYKIINTHVVLADGNLTVDPFAAELPGGHLSGTLAVDATQRAPRIHAVLHAPGLALKTILAAAHLPTYATGNLDVYADLSATGDSPHAIAASLDGSLGLAIAGGTIDNRLLGGTLGEAMDSLSALNLVGKGGGSELKCFAMRMDARHGIATIDPLALRSSLLTVTGAGTVNLDAETVALALRPQARIGGTALAIPIALSGPIRYPIVKVGGLGAAKANAGTVAGAVTGDATPSGLVGGLLGADKPLGSATTDICAPALAAARGQVVPDAAPAKTGKPGAFNPETFLKNLFR